MLLIDDDQSKLRKRQKQSRARPDDDPRMAGGDRPPGIAPRGLRHIGMPFDRGCTKPPPEAIEPLRAEGNLRQQHQHLPPGGEGCGDRGKISLGLARPGDAIEHGDGALTTLVVFQLVG